MKYDYSKFVSIVGRTKWDGKEVISLLFKFPTAKLAELRTHRRSSQLDFLDVSEFFETGQNDKVLPMNANSSRAIPKVAYISGDVYTPIWTKNQSGMQGDAADSESCDAADKIWEDLYLKCKAASERLYDLGIHKQDANMPMTIFSFTNSLVTMNSHQWEYFFKLRTNDAVYPFFRELARYAEKLIAEDVSAVEEFVHIPFRNAVSDMGLDIEEYVGAQGSWDELLSVAILVAASMTARISFDAQGKQDSVSKHIARAKRLIEEGHAIDEHIVFMDKGGVFERYLGGTPIFGNGTTSLRALLPLLRRFDNMDFFEKLRMAIRFAFKCSK